MKMSKVQKLRAVVQQRLTEAVEEIFGLFERTIAEYEEEVTRSQEEVDRQLLNAVWLHREALPPDLQQLLAMKDVPTEQQEWSPSLDQEDPEPPYIKEEQEDLWTSQEGDQLQEDPEPPHINVKWGQEELWMSQGGQLQGLEEADITKFPFTDVPVKSEYEEENPQSSQLHQSQTENREAEPLASCSTEQMKTEADGEDFGVSEPARNFYPASNLQPASNDKASGTLQHLSCYCSICGKRVGHKSMLKRHMIVHTGEKKFNCSACGKGFGHKSNLKRHMIVHTGDKLFNCPVCFKGFGQKGVLQRHMVIHTGEKEFICPVCGKGFGRKENMKTHMIIHTGDKPLKCPVCGKSFIVKQNLKRHMIIHSGDKQLNCSVCGQRFGQKGDLKRHMMIHTAE